MTTGVVNQFDGSGDTLDDGDHLILKFRGVDTIRDAEKLAGA